MTAPGVDTATAEAIREAVEDRAEAIEEDLVALVERETPSTDPDAFEDVLHDVAAELEAVGATAEAVPGNETGGRLEARVPGRREDPGPQLVLGHLDTVWPHGTLDENPPERRGDLLHGPGALDMKGGVVQLLHALAVLDDLDRDPALPVRVLLNTDEEIGSLESRDRIEEWAREAHRVLVLEPAAGAEGRVKTARKAVGRFTVTVSGEATHAGLDPGGGASATEELATLITRLHDLTDLEAGVTVNVGTVEAGTRPNVVAAEAQAVADVRAPTREAMERVEEQVRDLEAQVPGVDLAVDGGFGRPPMERTPRNRALWEQVRAAGDLLDLDLRDTRSGGGSDGSLASQHAATVDGLGPVGDGAHEDHEHVDLPALRDRTALLAVLLLAKPFDDPSPG